MFTGLVQQCGTFVGRTGTGDSATIEIACAPWDGDSFVKGESIAVQGACLTVVNFSAHGFTADVLIETLNCTNLGQLRRGDAVNLERALRVTDRLGGHWVSGHVDGLGEIVSITHEGRDYRVRVRCRPDEMRYIVRKGSIALDGISLTISAVPTPDCFEVCIIPTTWAETSLRTRKAGDWVNLETDVMARYLEKWACGATQSNAVGGVTMDQLARAGFV